MTAIYKHMLCARLWLCLLCACLLLWKMELKQEDSNKRTRAERSAGCLARAQPMNCSEQWPSEAVITVVAI